MKIKLSAQSKLSDIKETFNNSFPYLKLEFFRIPQRDTEPFSAADLIREDIRLKDINVKILKGEINANPSTKVIALESEFHDEFGLNVQVFRKSGNAWLETIGTDHMTLSEQNNLGMEKSVPPAKEDITDIDYD